MRPQRYFFSSISPNFPAIFLENIKKKTSKRQMPPKKSWRTSGFCIDFLTMMFGMKLLVDLEILAQLLDNLLGQPGVGFVLASSKEEHQLFAT